MSKEIAEAKKNLPSTELIDFSADAGAGLENADKDSFAIPFIAILQGLSPQMETVEGAKIGGFINTITNKLSASVHVVPCGFQRRYLEWAPRDQGGGFRGQHEVVAIESDPSVTRDDKNQLVTREGNLLKDTRMHYVLVVEEDGSFSPAIISMSSTQIKKSKRWLSMIQNVQLKDASGKHFNPPSFSHTYRLTSVKESNDSGAWYGYDVALNKQVADKELYAAAKKLNEQIRAGSIVASTPVVETADSNEKF